MKTSFSFSEETPDEKYHRLLGKARGELEHLRSLGMSADDMAALRLMAISDNFARPIADYVALAWLESRREQEKPK